jgi:hypothetical protein
MIDLSGDAKEDKAFTLKDVYELTDNKGLPRELVRFSILRLFKSGSIFNVNDSDLVKLTSLYNIEEYRSRKIVYD